MLLWQQIEDTAWLLLQLMPMEFGDSALLESIHGRAGRFNFAEGRGGMKGWSRGTLGLREHAVAHTQLGARRPTPSVQDPTWNWGTDVKINMKGQRFEKATVWGQKGTGVQEPEEGGPVRAGNGRHLFLLSPPEATLCHREMALTCKT